MHYPRRDLLVEVRGRGPRVEVLADDHVAAGAKQRVERILEVIAFHLVDRQVSVPLAALLGGLDRLEYL